MSRNRMTYDEKRKEYRQIFKDRVVKEKKLNCSTYCEGCLIQEEILEIHHVVPIRINGTNKITNMKRLCRACHQKKHGLLKLYRPLKVENRYFLSQSKCCDNCDSVDNLESTYVIPKSLGGKLNKHNISSLCAECRHSLETVTDTYGVISHSILTKFGIENAKDKGQKLGRPEVRQQAIIAVLYLRINLEMSKKEVAERVGISTMSIYRYIKRFDDKYIISTDDKGNLTLKHRFDNKLNKYIEKARIVYSYQLTIQKEEIVRKSSN